MGLTRDFKETIVERVRRDPDFAEALLDEAATLFLNGEPQTARLVLRDLVNATIGFEGLAFKVATFLINKTWVPGSSPGTGSTFLPVCGHIGREGLASRKGVLVSASRRR